MSPRQSSLAFSHPITEQRLVLVGGGHAHVQVIKALNHASRPDYLKVTLIDVQDAASYSGMVPGTIAGVYSNGESLLHLKPLAAWAGIEFVQRKVVDIDVDNNIVILGKSGGDSESDGHSQLESIPFDVISIDIGSSSRGLSEIPGAKEHTIPTRPISNLVRRLEEITKGLQGELKQSFQSQEPVKVVVIGGGTAGLELAMSIQGRWKPLIAQNKGLLDITVLDSGDGLMPGESDLNRQALQVALDERDISVRHKCRVQSIDKGCVELLNGEKVPYTHCIWATGAGAHDLAFRLQERGLAVSSRGWIQVNHHLQSISHGHVFAAGDCCTIEGLANGQSSPPKAGVYAVRSGPILIENLTRFMEQQRKYDGGEAELKVYEPQDDFLKLMVCGDGNALGFRFGIPFYGKWVFDLKHHIDSNFMDLFREENLPQLTADGQSYDTSQYDAGMIPQDELIPVREAATLLQRSENVDFWRAWGVLRAMNEDLDYRESILREMDNSKKPVEAC